MRKSRFSEDQIIAILKECGDGRAVPTSCRRRRVPLAVSNGWRLLSVLCRGVTARVQGSPACVRRSGWPIDASEYCESCQE